MLVRTILGGEAAPLPLISMPVQSIRCKDPSFMERVEEGCDPSRFMNWSEVPNISPTHIDGSRQPARVWCDVADPSHPIASHHIPIN